MKEENMTRNIKFWVDQNIIHCKFHHSFDAQDHISNLENIFLNGICELSNDKYMPILIDLQGIDFLHAIKLFRYLSNSKVINEAILIKAFLVSSLGLKLILGVYDFACNPIFPHKICVGRKLAIRHCNKYNSLFNGIK